MQIALGNGNREVIGGSYSRCDISFVWDDDRGAFVNDRDIVFPRATKHWGNISHAHLLHKGKVLYTFTLASCVYVCVSDSVTIAKGDIHLEIFKGK